MKREEEFKRLYEQWEPYLKTRYGRSNMHLLSKLFWQDEIEKCKKEGISENQLLGLVNIRNAYIHSSELLDIKQYAVVLLRKLINTFCKKAIDIATSKKEIHSASPHKKIQELIKEMKENLYTHVPVKQGDRFYGVFSENTLLKILASGRWSDSLKVGDVADLLKKTEGTDDYRFLSKDASFYDVYQLFQEYIDRRERLGVVFLTEDGKVSGNITGLITAWDLHKGIAS